MRSGALKWDGSSWTALGSGMNGQALAVSGSDLYVGGGFTTAGGRVSAFIARAYLSALPTLAVLRSGENVTVSWPTVDTAGFALETFNDALTVIQAPIRATLTLQGTHALLNWSGGGPPYRVERATDLIVGAWTDLLPDATPPVSLPLDGTAGFYRIIGR